MTQWTLICRLTPKGRDVTRFMLTLWLLYNCEKLKLSSPRKSTKNITMKKPQMEMMKWRWRDESWWLDTVMCSCRICHHDNWRWWSGFAAVNCLRWVGDDCIKERTQTTQDMNSPLLSGQPRVWIHNQWRCRCWLVSSLLTGASVTGQLTRLSYQADQVRQKTGSDACHKRRTTFQQDVENDQWIQPTENTPPSAAASAHD